MRRTGHRGEGPTASFEWAVSAIASIAVHLRESGYRLRLVTDLADIEASDSDGDGAILDHLAEVKLSPRADLGRIGEGLRRRADGGLVIAVLGMLSTEDADVVARWRWASGTAIGFLVDSSTWLTLPEPARLEADRARAATALRLVQAGWRVTGAAHGDRLPGLWQQVSRGAPGFAWRAAMAETVTTAGGTR